MARYVRKHSSAESLSGKSHTIREALHVKRQSDCKVVTPAKYIPVSADAAVEAVVVQLCDEISLFLLYAWDRHFPGHKRSSFNYFFLSHLLGNGMKRIKT